MLRPSRISTAILTYDKEGNLLVGEDSTINQRPSRVWLDACDVGYTVVSHRTGREIVYAMNLEVKDREGDIMYWEFIPAEPNAKFSNLPTLRVYND